MEFPRNESYQMITNIELCSKDEDLGRNCDYIINKFKEHPKFNNCSYSIEIKKENGLSYISAMLFVVQ